jgi:cob(I)alamin adenosyltransferase
MRLTLVVVGTRSQKRHLEDVQRRLMAARESLAVLEEQVAVWNEALDEARIRSLVSETPLLTAEYNELSKHVVAANAEMIRRSNDVQSLIAERDRLLRDLPKDENG